MPELPASIGQIQGLKVLHLNYNQLTSLPESIRTLDLSQLTKITRLNIASNELKELPDEMMHLKKSFFFKYYDNRFRYNEKFKNLTEILKFQEK